MGDVTLLATTDQIKSNSETQRPEVACLLLNMEDVSEPTQHLQGPLSHLRALGVNLKAWLFLL